MKDEKTQAQANTGPVAAWFYAAAFLAGTVVMVIEIAGARALAPFFGTSLKVWTAQITATMLFLALGYAWGAFLSRKSGDFIPALFTGAGLWLALYPFWRAPLLEALAAKFGVAPGSFACACALFGPPLAALGASSPLMVGRLERLGSGAGGAAGRLFFASTLGSLAGGWLTALVLVPFLPLRVALAGTGVFLIVLGLAWQALGRRFKPAWTTFAMLGLVMMVFAPAPTRCLVGTAQAVNFIYARQSPVGLIQVMDLPDAGSRYLMLDGITQGGMALASGRSILQFTESLNVASFRFHPLAARALLLGLGCGALARELRLRGVEVVVAEIEPQVKDVAVKYFGLPADVGVVLEDGREYLRKSRETFDLIFLDTYAGENMPYYLATSQAFKEMKAHLRPGGRVLVNTVTDPQGASPGLARMEATLICVFPEVWVGLDRPNVREAPLVNATLVAGEALKISREDFPGTLEKGMMEGVERLMENGRPARGGAKIADDDSNDMDYADADLRAKWRGLVAKDMGPEVLGD